MNNETPAMETNLIHTALLDAMRAIAKTGIAKLHKAALGGSTVNYRGIEDAMNRMSVILTECAITVTPTYTDVQIMERARGEGKAIRFAIVRGAFKFSASDGSFVSCEVYGEAMDSGDKALTKAQSVAFRTALFQQFVVPTMAIDPEAGGDDETFLSRVTDTTTEKELNSLVREGVAEFNKARDAAGLGEFQKAVVKHREFLKSVAAREADNV
jgi:hypothetical protein